MEDATQRGFEALVLAGGSGTRLRSVVSDRPKPLAEVDGEPFVVRILDQLVAAGCTRAILCTGHRARQIEAALGAEHRGMPLVYSREPKPLGTGGAVLHALPHVSGDDVVVLNGDSYTGVDLAQFVSWARHTNARAALVAVHQKDRSAFGALTLDGCGTVEAFAEKGDDPGPGPINAGIYWFQRAELAAYPRIRPLSLERDMLPTTVRDGLRAWSVDAPFLDIGTPATYAAAPDFLARCASRSPTVASRPRGLLVLDRDGTLIEECHYLDDPARVRLVPGAVEGLHRFAEEGFALAVVTNQSGIGRGLFSIETLAAIHDELIAQLAAENIQVARISYCPHHPDDGCACRKPAPGLLRDTLIELGYTPEQCVVVGDKPCDIQLGQSLGTRTALVRTGYGAATEQAGSATADFVADTLHDLAQQLFVHAPTDLAVERQS